MSIFPAAELYSQRLRFGLPTMDAVGQLLEAEQESWEQLGKIFLWAKGEKPTTDEGVKKFVINGAAVWQNLPMIPLEDYVYLLTCKENGRLLGPLSFTLCGQENDTIQLGYWIRQSEQGKGYVTEAVTHLSDYLLQHSEIKRVIISGRAQNNASRRIAEKAGFQFAGEGYGLSPLFNPPGELVFLCEKTRG